MKKVFVLFFSFLLIQNFAFSQNYQAGYDAGYHFGYNWVTEYVATHPELGQTFNYSGVTAITQSNYYGSGVATGMPLTTEGVLTVNSTVGFSNLQIANYAISSLNSTGAYEWLRLRAISMVDDYYWGVYDGFVIGTHDAMFSYPF